MQVQRHFGCWYHSLQRQTGLEISRRYWYWYFLVPWIETDTDTDTQTQSTSRPILILIPWKCTGTDTDTDILLNKNSAKTFQKMLRPLDRYRYWYRDSRNPWIETDTDTSCLGIGTFDTIPIFPSVSGGGGVDYDDDALKSPFYGHSAQPTYMVLKPKSTRPAYEGSFLETMPCWTK